jgi:uncharacterized protein YoaH (UPF0181 family)
MCAMSSEKSRGFAKLKKGIATMGNESLTDKQKQERKEELKKLIDKELPSGNPTELTAAHLREVLHKIVDLI